MRWCVALNLVDEISWSRRWDDVISDKVRSMMESPKDTNLRCCDPRY